MDINTTPYLTHSESLFVKLIDNTGGLYKEKVQDKMKFGKPQLIKMAIRASVISSVQFSV
jgi:hypothetical protein